MVGSSEDWATARASWEGGASYRTAEAAVGGRISMATIRRRALAEGWERDIAGVPARADAPLAVRQAQTEAAREANKRRWVEHKDHVVSDLIGLIDGFIAEIQSPAELIHVKTVGEGEGRSSVEVVRVAIDRPVPADQQRLTIAMATALDKVLLVSGEATSRNEQIAAGDRGAAVARAKELRDEVAARREQRAAAAEEAG